MRDLRNGSPLMAKGKFAVEELLGGLAGDAVPANGNLVELALELSLVRLRDPGVTKGLERADVISRMFGEMVGAGAADRVEVSAAIRWVDVRRVAAERKVLRFRGFSMLETRIRLDVDAELPREELAGEAIDCLVAVEAALRCAWDCARTNAVPDVVSGCEGMRELTDTVSGTGTTMFSRALAKGHHRKQGVSCTNWNIQASHVSKDSGDSGGVGDGMGGM